MVKDAQRRKKKMMAKTQERSAWVLSGLFLISWLALCAIILTFPGYVWLNPLHIEWNFAFPSWAVVLILMGLMIMTGWFIRPKSPVSSDLSLLWVQLGLFAVAILTLVLCTYHWSVPANFYAYDASMEMTEPVRINALGDFRSTFVFNENGFLPIWPYTALFLWRILPNFPVLVVGRLTSTIFELAAIIILYQVGKEIGSRRVGLYCAAIVAISKPLLYKIVSGYGYSVLFFCMALVLLMTFRLIRKDNPKRYLWWGFSVGLSAYSCYPVQPFVFCFIFGGLFFVWWNNRKTMSLKNSNPWVWLTSGLLALFAMYCVGSISLEKWAGALEIMIYQPVISCVLLALVLVFVVIYWKGWLKISSKNLWYQWIWGAWLAALLAFPALTHPIIMNKIKGHGWVQGTDYLSTSYISLAFQHLPNTLKGMFWSYEDRLDMSMMWDPFFSYSEAILIVLGLVFCLIRPNAKRLFILAASVMGVIPHFFAGRDHSGLLIGCLVPLWLIAAIGLDDLTEMVLKLGSSKSLRFSFSAILIFFLGWSAQKVYERVCLQWLNQYQDITQLRVQATADMKNPRKRVYFSQQLFTTWADFTYEGLSFYYWDRKLNPVCLDVGAEVPDVVLYIVSDDDLKIVHVIESNFPHAHWEVLGSPLQAKGIYPYRCEIPAEDVRKSRNPLLSVQWTKGDHWNREEGMNDLGLNFSGIVWEDKVVNVQAPRPGQKKVNYQQDSDLRLTSTIHIAKTGRHEIVCNTMNRTILRIDEKKVFDLMFPRFWDYIPQGGQEKAEVTLQKGDHSVEFITYFQTSNKLPDVTIREMGTSQSPQSLWGGFSFE